MATQNSLQARTQFGNIFFREIHKNAWLKKATASNVKKKREKLWVVFCVHDDTDAFLEIYVDNKIAVLHKPDSFVYLNEVQHISPTICPQEQEYEFVLTLRSEVVRLSAPTWDQMLDWVSSLQGKLHELRILSPKDNIYTKLPEAKGPLLPTRDPTSPLPPPPVSLAEILPGIEAVHIESDQGSSHNSGATPHESNGAVNNNGSTDTVVFNFEQLPEPSPLPQSNHNNTPRSGCHYEHIFHSSQNEPGPSTRRPERAAPVILQQPPQPYKTFREQQVLQLQKEMKHAGGVRVQLRRKDCISSIALADAFDSVWICGWKQKEHPMLYNALHIGDKLMSIAGVSVRSATDAYRILESHFCSLYVDFVIKRIPYGQIFLIHRETEGQSLGIVQENNTAVIESIETDSLVARHGLTAKAKNQVRDRLNSVGRDISILVQPLDLVKHLKKELKSLRNYKEYILQ